MAQLKRSPIRQPQIGEMPAHTASISASKEMPAWLQLQQILGNRASYDLMQTIQRQTTNESETPSSANAPLAPEILNFQLERELPGHGYWVHPLLHTPTIQRTPPTSPPSSPPPTTTANITLNVNPPTIVRKTEAQISSDHGREGVAGWCTPNYNIQVPSGNATTINVTITLGFVIELASEYEGDPLAILSDHEQGHVIIGKRVAQTHLVAGLRDQLQSLPNFTTAAPIQQNLNNAANSFVTEEGTQSSAYDTADYPRMREAYFGVHTSLPDLVENSPDVERLVNRLEDFITYAHSVDSSGTDESGLINCIHGIVAARTSLDEADVSRLQYNPEFKTMVSHAQSLVPALTQAFNESDQTALNELQLLLAGFTWQANP